MHADEFADTARSGCSSVGRSFDRRDIATDDSRDKARANLFITNERNVCSFDHCIGCFDHRDQPFGLNHSECFLHSDVSCFRES
jgi:hypothetical protein